VSFVLVVFTSSAALAQQCSPQYCGGQISQVFIGAECNRGRYLLGRGQDVGITVDFVSDPSASDGNIITQVHGTLDFLPIPVPYGAAHNKQVCDRVVDHVQNTNSCRGINAGSGYRYTDGFNVPSYAPPNANVKVDYKLVNSQGDVVCLVIPVRII